MPEGYFILPHPVERYRVQESPRIMGSYKDREWWRRWTQASYGESMACPMKTKYWNRPVRIDQFRP